MPRNGRWNSSQLILCLVAIVVASWALISYLSPASSASAVGSLFRHNRQPPSLATDNDSIKQSQTIQREALSLKHVFHHGAGKPGPRARRLDISPARAIYVREDVAYGPFAIKIAPVTIDRPVIRQQNMQIPISPLFVSEDLAGPDVTDKETVIQLAYMCEDAYKPDRSDPEWIDVDDKYNNSLPFGWEDSGIRGHVFTDDANKTVILSVKGTTVAMFDGNGTSSHDKENDNLFGSCCCGQGGSYLWRQVCDCQTGTYTCDNTCVKEEIRKPNRYYEATLELYDEVMKLYPNANIIATGHSLGGVLASLIGLHRGIPSVSFEAYPQALAASRLGLPTAGQLTPLRKNTGGFHFGHTGDPVYMGTCNGVSSFCAIAGYAFETICHTGKRCVYDVVKDWGWRQSTSYHRLRYAIDNVYAKYDTAAPCVEEDVECQDCFLWKFEDGTKTRPSTTNTAAPTMTTRTRTETCKTPGWWGCRDETTTATTGSITTSTSEVTTTSTSTCKTPGWFGCKDKTTTGTESTSTETATTTTTCTSKGWFGRCLDPTSTTTIATSTTPVRAAAYAYLTAPTATQTAL